MNRSAESPTESEAALDRLLATLSPSDMRLGLGPMRRLLAQLGWDTPSAPVVHVAGTNGKGSTALLLAALASAGGSRVGLYTSPHLESARERLRIDGRAIAASRLTELLQGILAASDTRVTYFEAMTAAALGWFHQESVDLVVLEVGLGGRLDATNAVDGSLSVVSAIDLDHTQWLGSTLEEIAAEKAGVFRAGRPAVTARQKVGALGTLEDQARRRGTTLVVAEDLPRGLDSPFEGRHQRENAALAWAASRRLPALGLDSPDLDSAVLAWSHCRHPGRLERVRLPTGRTVLLDGAHNPAAAEALAAALAGERYDLLFGALADKDVGNLLAPLASRAGRVGLTEPPSPRALAPDALAASVARVFLVENDPGIALKRMLESDAGAEDSLLVVAGSLFLVGCVRPLLTQLYGVPPRAVELSTWGTEDPVAEG